MPRQLRLRTAALTLAASATVALLALASPSRGDLSSRARDLKQGVAADSRAIAAYEGRLSDLEARLGALQSSLDVQRQLLVRIDGDLARARVRLGLLRGDLVRDRRILAAELVAQYESPAPNLMNVVIDAHGFTDLLERVEQMKSVANLNVRAIRAVSADKLAVTRQARTLAAERIHQQRVTAAVLIERDQVERLRLDVLRHEQVAAGDRARKQSQLRTIERQLAALQAKALAAQRASFATFSPGASGGAVVPDGAWGFFPAAGTNYSVGEEPTIAARLNTLGKALHLHLIGISGYRSPAHSVEVGGFADDPHTRGEASDTPGVEGVPESVLLQYGLTRPFGGAREADHIQLA